MQSGDYRNKIKVVCVELFWLKVLWNERNVVLLQRFSDHSPFGVVI